MRTILALGLGLVLTFGSSLLADELTVEEFEKLHAEIVPIAPVWKSIPWHMDLLSAQAVAAEQKKLIFIWSMDGHPLGCT